MNAQSIPGDPAWGLTSSPPWMGGGGGRYARGGVGYGGCLRERKGNGEDGVNYYPTSLMYLHELTSLSRSPLVLLNSSSSVLLLKNTSHKRQHSKPIPFPLDLHTRPSTLFIRQPLEQSDRVLAQLTSADEVGPAEIGVDVLHERSGGGSEGSCRVMHQCDLREEGKVVLRE